MYKDHLYFLYIVREKTHLTCRLNYNLHTD